MVYAEKTNVSIERTEGEIKGLLRRYKAKSFGSMEEPGMVILVFEMSDRRIVFRLPLPDRNDDEFAKTPSGRRTRSPEQQYVAWEQACRSRWRALFLCIKAKLESVESGIETFEDAFLAHVMMPDGMTVGEHTRPKIAHVYETEKMQPLLPGPAS